MAFSKTFSFEKCALRLCPLERYHDIAYPIPEQTRYIYVEISVDFIKRRPKSDLKLVFEDDTGIKHESNEFKQGDLVLWNLDMSVHLWCNHSSETDRYRTGTLGPHSNVTLTIRHFGAHFKTRIADISVEFELNDFVDDSAVELEGFSLYLLAKRPSRLAFPQIPTITLL